MSALILSRSPRGGFLPGARLDLPMKEANTSILSPQQAEYEGYPCAGDSLACDIIVGF
jgi:hypothetical protein